MPTDTLMASREYKVMFQMEQEYFWYRALHNLTLREIRRITKLGMGGGISIVDCGCGTGGLLAVLKPYFPRLTGFDFSSDAVNFCRQRGFGDVRQMSITDITLPEESFDLACSLDVLCVLETDQFKKGLSQIRMVLKPGGFFIFNLPAFEHMRSEHDDAVMIKRRFRRGELRWELQAAGFDVEWINYRVSVLFPALWLVRMLKKFTKPPAAEAHSDLKPLFSPLNALLTFFLKLENWIVPHVPMPFGLSVFGVARRRD